MLPSSPTGPAAPATLLYDGTMAGLLCCIFDVYESKLQEASIAQEGKHLPDVFSTEKIIRTDALQARRVWRGLGKKTSPEAQQQFFQCFLSELPGIENTLLAYARHVFGQAQNVEKDYAFAPVLEVQQTARKVWREKHRMEAFIRFQQLQDGLWYAAASPDYNVLPLITRHFKSRYADMPWLIYDLKRHYGMHYTPDTETVTEVTLDVQEGATPATPDASLLVADEAGYQLLWKDYFKHTGIPARKNVQLHLRHIPARYWRYLTEKQL